jgi:hypothetical protein
MVCRRERERERQHKREDGHIAEGEEIPKDGVE